MVTIAYGITLKTRDQVEIMAQGGKLMAGIKKELRKLVKEGNNAWMIEKKASELIKKTGGQSSFKMVPGYHWSTCVNVNSGLVHGIPDKKVIFKKGDLVSVDIGLYYKGFHTDSSFSLAINLTKETKNFLMTGETALKRAISQIQVGKRIYDISRAIEEIIVKDGYSPIKALVGHGVGANLHEQPAIPCFTEGKRENSPRILEGMILAVEVMYAQGSEEVFMADDGWTISTCDGKISALFEETIAATKQGPKVLTA